MQVRRPRRKEALQVFVFDFDAERFRAVADEVDDPLERLHRSVVTIYEWSENDPGAGTPSPHLTVRSMAAFVFDLISEPEA